MITVFFTDGNSGVKNLDTCVLDFVSCLWSDQSEFMALFRVFNLWIDPILFLSHVVNFLFFNSHFPVTIFGLHLFSGK